MLSCVLLATPRDSPEPFPNDSLRDTALGRYSGNEPGTRFCPLVEQPLYNKFRPMTQSITISVSKRPPNARSLRSHSSRVVADSTAAARKSEEIAASPMTSPGSAKTP